MEKILCIGFSRNGSTNNFTRLNLIESMQLATFGRKSPMDFCFTYLSKSPDGFYYNDDGQQFEHHSSEGSHYFVSTKHLRDKGSDCQEVVSVNILADFLKYVDKLRVTLRSFGRFRGRTAWLSNLDKNFSLIAGHLKTKYQIDVEVDVENDRSKVTIVREEPKPLIVDESTPSTADALSHTVEDLANVS